MSSAVSIRVNGLTEASNRSLYFLDRARRQQLLAGISDRQRKRTRDKAAQMSERRLEAESVSCRELRRRWLVVSSTTVASGGSLFRRALDTPLVDRFAWRYCHRVIVLATQSCLSGPPRLTLSVGMFSRKWRVPPETLEGGQEEKTRTKNFRIYLLNKSNLKHWQGEQACARASRLTSERWFKADVCV